MKKLNTGAKLAVVGATKVKRERATGLIELVVRRKSEIVESFYDIGEALRELRDKKLYLALKHDSFEEMLRERKVIGHAQAYRLMRLVEKVPRKVAVSLGSEKASALTEWVELTEEKDTVADLVKSNAVIAGKPIKKVSSRELANEIKAERARRAKQSSDPKVRARAKQLADYVSKVKAVFAAAGAKNVEVVHTTEHVIAKLTFAQAKMVQPSGDKPAQAKKR